MSEEEKQEVERLIKLVPQKVDKQWKCPVCPKEFARKDHYNAHMVRHGEKKIKCNFDQCGRLFHTESELTQHQAVHSVDRPFICECGASFKRMDNLRRHQLTHSEGKKFSCSFCEQTFVQKGDWITHELREKVKLGHTLPFFTCELEGCVYKTQIPEDLASHHYNHTPHGNKANRAKNLKQGAERSLSSHVTYMKSLNSPLHPAKKIENLEEIEELESFQEFKPIFKTMLAKKVEDQPYNATLFVMYELPEGVEDLGPLEAFRVYGNDPSFKFYFYYGSSVRGTCIHLKVQKRVRKKYQSNLVKLIEGGGVCHRLNFQFPSDKEMEGNFRAFLWQRFYKVIAQLKQRFGRMEGTAEWIILNKKLSTKSNFRKSNVELTMDDLKLAWLFAQEDRPLLPLDPHLLPTGFNPRRAKFIPYDLKSIPETNEEDSEDDEDSEDEEETPAKRVKLSPPETYTPPPTPSSSAVGKPSSSKRKNPRRKLDFED